MSFKAPPFSPFWPALKPAGLGMDEEDDEDDEERQEREAKEAAALLQQEAPDGGLMAKDQ